MRGLGGFLNLAAAVLLLPALATAGVPAPLSGSGDFSFSADLPVFHDAEGARVDLAVSVPHSEIEFPIADDGLPTALLELEVKLARQGVVSVDTTQVYELPVRSIDDAVSSTRFQLLEMPLRPGPGRWAVTVRLRDRGRNLLNADAVEAEADGVIEVPRWDAGVARLSDPEFRMQSGDQSLANPGRMFGISQDTLRAYVELDRAEPGERYDVDVEFLDPVYGGMQKEVWTLTPATARAASLLRVPLSTFPEGSFLMRMIPRWAPEMTAEHQFSVSWRMDRVVQTGRDVLKEGMLVLDASEWGSFRRLSRSAQLQALQDFWDRLDPTPGTSANELYDRFLARVAYADRQYAAFGRAGSLTDRGRIHVWYGEPLDIQVEVIPLNADDLEVAIGRVHDVYQMDRTGITAKEVARLGVNSALEVLSSQERRRRIGEGVEDNIGFDQKRNVGRVGEEGSFEVWEYEFQGDPLFPDDTITWSNSLHARFLFVDRMGTGDYHLEFTNIPLKF